MNQKKSSITK